MFPAARKLCSVHCPLAVVTAQHLSGTSWGKTSGQVCVLANKPKKAILLIMFCCKVTIVHVNTRFKGILNVFVAKMWKTYRVEFLLGGIWCTAVSQQCFYRPAWCFHAKPMSLCGMSGWCTVWFPNPTVKTLFVPEYSYHLHQSASTHTHAHTHHASIT